MNLYDITNLKNGRNEIVNEDILAEISYDILHSYGEYEELNGLNEIVEVVESEYKVYKHKQKDGFYSYSGFNEPVYLANSLTELIDSIVVTHSYLIAEVDETNEFKSHINDLLEWLKIESDEVTDEHKEYFEGLLFDYGIWWNPTYKELAEYNKHVGLEEDTYIENFFE